MTSPPKRRRWTLNAFALMYLVSNAHGLDPNRSLSQYVREHWNTESRFPGGAVNAIAQTTDGYLWLGTDKGLFRFDGFNFMQASFSPIVDASKVPVLSLLTHASGNLWVRVQGSDVLRLKNGKFESVASGAGRRRLVWHCMTQRLFVLVLCFHRHSRFVPPILQLIS